MSSLNGYRSHGNALTQLGINFSQMLCLLVWSRSLAESTVPGLIPIASMTCASVSSVPRRGKLIHGNSLHVPHH